MRFIHLSDCHIGGWRDDKIGNLSILAFKKAIDESIAKNVDFVLIAGDLFNSALPPIDKLKEVVLSLKKLKKAGINCYVVPGSHDFSPSGKTMIDILEHTELLINVCKGEVIDGILKLKFTIDPKTNVKITGILGKKGMLDKKYYEALDKEALEKESGFKIFLFHTALTELKPKEMENMESSPISLLPSGFDYYAGGHVHMIENKEIMGYKNIVYAGALFPNNFRELEEFKNGGYYFYDDGTITFVPVIVKDVEVLTFNCSFRSSSQVYDEILQKIKTISVDNKIVTIRVVGELSSGKISDLNFNELFGILLHKGAYYVMKSTTLVKTKEFERMQTTASSIEETEEKTIKENMPGQEEFVKELMKVLSLEKQEGETNYNFEKRLIEESNKIISK